MAQPHPPTHHHHAPCKTIREHLTISHHPASESTSCHTVCVLVNRPSARPTPWFQSHQREERTRHSSWDLSHQKGARKNLQINAPEHARKLDLLMYSDWNDLLQIWQTPVVHRPFLLLFAGYGYKRPKSWFHQNSFGPALHCWPRPATSWTPNA